MSCNAGSTIACIALLIMQIAAPAQSTAKDFSAKSVVHETKTARPQSIAHGTKAADASHLGIGVVVSASPENRWLQLIPGKKAQTLKKFDVVRMDGKIKYVGPAPTDQGDDPGRLVVHFETSRDSVSFPSSEKFEEGIKVSELCPHLESKNALNPLDWISELVDALLHEDPPVDVAAITRSVTPSGFPRLKDAIVNLKSGVLDMTPAMVSPKTDSTSLHFEKLSKEKKFVALSHPITFQSAAGQPVTAKVDDFDTGVYRVQAWDDEKKEPVGPASWICIEETRFDQISSAFEKARADVEASEAKGTEAKGTEAKGTDESLRQLLHAYMFYLDSNKAN